MMTHNKGIIPFVNYTLISRSTATLTTPLPVNVSSSNATCNIKLEHGISYVLLIAFPIIFVVSLAGNFLVILTISRNRSMHTVTNLFLLNLAITDLLLTIICMPPTWTGYLFQCFFYGSLMCPIFSYMQPLSVAASAYTLVAIALERYKAICKPLQSQHWKTKSHVTAIILGVWVFSCVITIPSAVCSTLLEYDTGKYNCRDTFDTTDRQIYYFFLTVMLFVVPLFVMLSLYSSVILTLWQGIRLDEGPPSTRETGSDEEIQSLKESDGFQNRFWHKISRSLYDKPHKRSGVSVLSADDLDDLPSTSSTTVSSVSTRMRIFRPLSDRKTWSLQKIASRSVKNGRRAKTTTTPQQKWSSSYFSGSEKANIAQQVSLRSTHAERSLLSKKRVIRMLIMIVIEFFVCWTPLYGYLLYYSIAMHGNRYYHVLFLHLAFLSSCTNPITYCFVNVKFRKAMLNAIGCRSNSTTCQQKNYLNNTTAYMKRSTTVATEPVCRSKSIMMGTSTNLNPLRKITFSGLPSSPSSNSKTPALTKQYSNGSHSKEVTKNDGGSEKANINGKSETANGESHF